MQSPDKPAPGPRSQGWTLLELMVVLAIIALIAALVGPAFLTQTEEAKVKSLQTALDEGLRSSGALLPLRAQ